MYIKGLAFLELKWTLFGKREAKMHVVCDWLHVTTATRIKARIYSQ